MYDPRWDDPRERDDGRARGYDERGRADHDPRDGLMRDLDLPRGEARELVVDREHTHELNGEDSRALAAVGAFRLVPERELGSDRDNAPVRDTLDHLRDEGLIRTIALNEHDHAVVLTDEGRDLLDANRRERGEGESQAFHSGVNRPRELDHDAYLYATYREEEARLRQEHGYVEVRRVVLEEDLKRDYQNFLQDHNRDRSDSDGRPDRDEEEIRRWAQDHELPYFDDGVGPFFQRASAASAAVPAADRALNFRIIGVPTGTVGVSPERPRALALHTVPPPALQGCVGAAYRVEGGDWMDFQYAALFERLVAELQR